MEGTIIKNRYRLEHRLGEGGMGVVFRALDEAENRVVAIKIAGLSSYHEGSARFQREARSMLTLSHPNIVQVYETGEDGALSFIVMEYLEGRPLNELIPLSIHDALDIAIQVATALEFAHGHGIIHRDIKPENLMVLPPPQGGTGHLVKVMDFGLARRLEDQYQLTESGMLIGTAAYISPEQALGYRVDFRSDLYSLGVVLYEVLVGQSPFRGDSFVGVVYQHLNETPPSPRKYNSSIPVALEHAILRLLRKEPTERFGSAAELAASLIAIRGELALTSATMGDQGPPLSPPTLTTSLPLIGREDEFTTLKECIQQAIGGQGQLVMISGEPGIGKTRLSQEVLTYARLCGVRVFSAVCYEHEESFPYQPFMEILRTFALRSTWQDTQVLRQSMQGYMGELIALLPEMARLFEEVQPPVRMMSPEQERARLFEAVRRFVLGASQSSPVVLFLDDLQWADSTSLLLLQYVVRRTCDQPVLILTTYRTTEMSAQLSDFLNVLSREKLCRTISLECLSPEKCATLVNALLGSENTPDHVQERIYTHTEGNPFFIVETIQHLMEEGLLAREEAAWQSLSTIEPKISARVRDIIVRRLTHIPSRTTRILAAGAVIGREFSFTLLKDLTGVSDDELLQALDAGLYSGLIRERQQRAEEHYDFSHALIREVIYTGLTAARRRSLHQQAAAILERRVGDRKDQVLGELAYHYSHGHDVGKAIEYNLLAGKQAAAVYATEDAFRYFETARETAEEEGRTEHLVEILEGLGQISIILGRFETAVDSFRQAIGVLESQEPVPVTKLVKLLGEISTAYERIGRYDDALADLERGLVIAGGVETVESAYLRGQLATIYSRRGDIEKAMDYARQDLAIAEDLDNEEEMAQACTILYKLHSLRSDWNSARRFTERALDIWKKRNDVYRQEWNYLNLGAILWSLGHWEEAEQNWHKALDISRAIRYTQGIVQNSLNIGFLSLHRNNLSAAEGFFREALGLAREIGHTYYVARSTMRIAELSRRQGDLTTALELFAEAESILRELGHKTALSELLWLYADTLVEQGRLDSAEKAAEEAIALAPKPEGYEEIGNASLVMARVYLARGDREHALLLLHQGIDCLDSLGDVYQQAKARTHLAGFLADSGSPSDLDQALVLLRVALTDFQRVGSVSDIAKVGAMLSDLRGVSR